MWNRKRGISIFALFYYCLYLYLFNVKLKYLSENVIMYKWMGPYRFQLALKNIRFRELFLIIIFLLLF